MSTEHNHSEESEAPQKWYIRYPIAVFFLFLAYVAYGMWAEGHRGSGVMLLMLNPVASGIFALIAVINAWEVGLVSICIGAIYFAYVGLAALPVSVAIVVGSLIVAIAIRTKP